MFEKSFTDGTPDSPQPPNENKRQQKKKNIWTPMRVLKMCLEIFFFGAIIFVPWKFIEMKFVESQGDATLATVNGGRDEWLAQQAAITSQEVWQFGLFALFIFVTIVILIRYCRKEA